MKVWHREVEGDGWELVGLAEDGPLPDGNGPGVYVALNPHTAA